MLQKLLLPWKSSASPELLEPVRWCWNIRPRTSDAKIILRAFCREKKTSLSNLPSKSSRVTVPSTYSHQCFPSVETGISQLDHLQARWIQTQATTGGVYCRLKVVRCRLTSPGEKTKSHQLPRLSCRSTWGMGGERGPLGHPRRTLRHRQLHPAPAQRGFACSGLLCYREFGLSFSTSFLFMVFREVTWELLSEGKSLGICQPHLCSGEKLILVLLQEIWDLLQKKENQC